MAFLAGVAVGALGLAMWEKGYLGMAWAWVKGLVAKKEETDGPAEE